ncbi:MAG: PLDc N-terminal domain-containing protein [Bacteroidota bacterium]
METLLLANLFDYLSNPLASPLVLLLVILDVVALRNLWRSSRGDSSKIIWTLVIILFPVGGLIAWWIFG